MRACTYQDQLKQSPKVNFEKVRIPSTDFKFLFVRLLFFDRFWVILNEQINYFTLVNILHQFLEVVIRKKKIYSSWIQFKMVNQGVKI